MNIQDFIIRGSEVKNPPKLFGFKTGVLGLDDMFYTITWTDDKPVKSTLGGIPAFSVVNLTGMPDTGKSLIANQYTVKQTSMEYPVLFVTTETPAEFLILSLMQKAKAMGVDWDDIKDNVWIIDASKNSVLREDIHTLLKTMEKTIEMGSTKSIVIDSITGLFEDREMKARSIVRQIYSFAKHHRQTTILVNQKRSGHDEISAEAAGGFAVAHIADVNIVLWKVTVTKKWEVQLYGSPIGSLVRFIRVDGCRVSGHDQKTHFLEITDTGLVKVGPPLGKDKEETGYE